MAPSDLAEIRALLIAQTDAPEPRRASARAPSLLGVVGGLLKPRSEPPAPARPLNLGPPPPRFTSQAHAQIDHDDEAMLLLGEEIDPDLFMPLDLPPPPRAEFGVRSPRPYLPHDSVLLLNKLAPAQPRRLTLLTDAGEAVGEIYLKPQNVAATPVHALHPEQEHEAPYFPGDLDEDHIPSPRRLFQSTSPVCVNPAPNREGLERDLLGALALTLTREHEALCDRVTPFFPVLKLHVRPIR